MVICFGEVMLRLGAPKGTRLEQVLPGKMEATFGGSEVNVAASLARYGTPVKYVTALPPGPLTDAFKAELRGLGVDVLARETPDCRFGLYFVEHGAGPRGGAVYYDRAGSGVAETRFADYAFDELLAKAKALHISGITPALSRTACETTISLAKTAREKGLFVSCDLNYRAKLWRWEEEKNSRELAREWMPKIIENVDLLIGNESDFSDCLGLSAGNSTPESGVIDGSEYEQVAREAVALYPSLKYIATSLRESESADINHWGGMLFDVEKGELYQAPLQNGEYSPYELQITDRFGAGDSFSAGLLHALFSDDLSSSQDAVQFAVAASALKHTIHGDYNRVSREEVIRLMRGNQTGRVQR